MDMTRAFLMSLLLLSTSEGLAQTFFNPAKVAGQNRMLATFSLTRSEIEYDPDGGRDFEVDRTILGASFNVGMGQAIDLFGQLGYSIDAEIEDSDADGSGFTMGGGINVAVLQERGLRVHVGGLLNYTLETYENDTSLGDIEYELSILDIHAFGNVGFVINPAIMPYLGLDLIFLSNGEIEVELPGGGDADDDIERDDSIALVLGSNFLAGSFILRAEVRLAGEQTVTLSGSTNL